MGDHGASQSSEHLPEVAERSAVELHDSFEFGSSLGSPSGSQVAEALVRSPPRQPTHLRVTTNARPNLGRVDGYSSDDGGDSVLLCRTMRHLLESTPSPFLNDRYFGGGFVSDEDRVSLQSLLFASPASRGAQEARRSLTGAPLSAHANTTRIPAAVAGQALGLARTLSTPRSSIDTNQDSYFEAVPRFALRAGPRETIYYQPHNTRIAIVCSGGICPGMNDIIRALVLKAEDYGVPEGNILGIRLGWRGFYCNNRAHKPVVLTRQSVGDIHLEGGTVLGTCEDGECDVREVVKCLDLWAVDMLFVIGGHHEFSTAAAIEKMCERCEVPCAVVAVPNSIDNDFLMLDKTFGFETAVEEAQKALLAAGVEASSAYRGIGLVKLMGRRSGFIAVKAALASGLVDVLLIPEVPFKLDSVLTYLEHILTTRGHGVVCMAEGAGQEMFPHCTPGQDPFTCQETDVGSWLKGEIKRRLPDVDVKYIDPSYQIRSIPPTADDRVYCKMLAHGALHAGFAGYTGVAVGQVNTHMVYLPLEILAQAPRQVDPSGEMWHRVKQALGQPTFDGSS